MTKMKWSLLFIISIFALVGCSSSSTKEFPQGKLSEPFLEIPYLIEADGIPAFIGIRSFSAEERPKIAIYHGDDVIPIPDDDVYGLFYSKGKFAVKYSNYIWYDGKIIGNKSFTKTTEMVLNNGELAYIQNNIIGGSYITSRTLVIGNKTEKFKDISDLNSINGTLVYHATPLEKNDYDNSQIINNEGEKNYPNRLFPVGDRVAYVINKDKKLRYVVEGVGEFEGVPFDADGKIGEVKIDEENKQYISLDTFESKHYDNIYDVLYVDGKLAYEAEIGKNVVVVYDEKIQLGQYTSARNPVKIGNKLAFIVVREDPDEHYHYEYVLILD